MSDWLNEIGENAMKTYEQMSYGAIGVVMVIYTICFIIVVLIFVVYAIKSWIYMIKSLFIKKVIKNSNDIINGKLDRSSVKSKILVNNEIKKIKTLDDEVKKKLGKK